MNIKKLKEKLAKLDDDDMTHIRAWLSGQLSVRKFQSTLTPKQLSDRSKCFRRGGSWLNGKCIFPLIKDNIIK